MKTTPRSATRLLAVAVAGASLIVLAAGNRLLAQAAPQSDELIISMPGAPGPGPILQDTVIPETAGAGTQSSALYAPGTGLAPLEPPGALAVLVPGPLVGATYVILAEPAAEPIDPTELPPVFFGNVRVSDLLVNGINNQSGLPPFIALISDNNPDLAFALGKIPVGTVPPIVLETGGVQDLTALIGPAVIPGIGALDVQVRSDVPEPSSIVILLGFVGTGLFGLIRHRRRTA